MPNRLSMVVFSGTVDKLYPVAIMASGAVAMGMDVDLFLTFYGLARFLPKVGRLAFASVAEMFAKEVTPNSTS